MKVLIIGLGSIAKKHIDALNKIEPEIEIIAFRSDKNSKSYLNVKNIYELNKNIISDVDFIIVSNPSSKHKKTIEQLIPYEKPLFIEKPLHYSLDMSATVEMVSKLNVVTYVACNLRFLDCLRFIKDNLADVTTKRINEINVYCGSYLPEWRPEVDFRNSYSAQIELGGGVHLDLIHELDYLYWLFGCPKYVSRSFKNQSSLAIKSYDYANYVLDYDGFSASVILNYFRRDSKRSMELVFSDETWYLDLLFNRITCNGKVVFESKQKIKDTYENQMKYFIDCLKDQTSPFNSVENAYDVLKICLEK